MNNDSELFSVVDSMGKSLNHIFQKKIILIDEDSSDDELVYEYSEQLRGSRIKPTRTQGFATEVIPHFTNNQFQEHFRLSLTSFERCLQLCCPLLKKTKVEGRQGTDERLQLLSVIWLLATPDSFRSVSDRFGVGKSTLHDSFVRVIIVLNKLSPTIISWPRLEEMQIIQQNFKRMSKAGLSNIIGAIDGSYIPIPAPKESPNSYLTRKCFHAITLQVVCDDKLNITDAFAGYPGSVGDRRVFTNSLIYKSILQNKERYVPNQSFIIADKAYPVFEWCIPPYIDRGTLTEQEKFFNITLSRARQAIERCFALLKGRFRRLKYLDMKKIDLIPQTIIACCVLHNICLQFDNNHWMETLLADQPQNLGDEYTNEILVNEDNTQSGCMKRDRIMVSLV